MNNSIKNYLINMNGRVKKYYIIINENINNEVSSGIMRKKGRFQTSSMSKLSWHDHKRGK